MSPELERFSREELEQKVVQQENRISSLEQKVETIDGLIDVRGGDISDIFIAGHPIGSLIEGASERSKKALNGDGQAQNVVGEEARGVMVEAHRELLDYQQGAKDDLSGSALRAVIFFRQFARKVDPDHDMVGVELSHGRYKLKRDRAEWVLNSEGCLPETGASTIIKRAMKKLADMTDGLFRFEDANSYVVSVAQDDWEEYLKRYQSALEGRDVSINADDDSEQLSEAPDEASVDEQFETLHEAEPRVANSVVSNQDEGALEGGNH